MAERFEIVTAFEKGLAMTSKARLSRERLQRNLPCTSLKVSKILYILSIKSMLQRFCVLIHAQIPASNLFCWFARGNYTGWTKMILLELYVSI